MEKNSKITSGKQLDLSGASSNEKSASPNLKIPVGIRWAAGLLGSTFSSFLCSPLDLIKVRLQVSYEKESKKYSGFFDAIKTIYREEGMRGFFKGTRVAVVSVPIFYSFYFPLYEHFKTYYSNRFYADQNKTSAIVYTCSAVSSALICDLITNPMWVVRVRYQAEFITSGSQKIDSFNVWRSVKKLYQKEGFFALYRGLFVSMFGIPHVIIQFNMYEHLKKFAANKYNKTTDDLPSVTILFISVVSKVSASFCTYPHEVVRNNLQNVRDYEERKMGMVKLMKEIYKERGVSGFYAGFKINLVRILPNTAIMFMTYEYLSKFLAKEYNMLKSHL